jgi:hypothetical protein
MMSLVRNGFFVIHFSPADQNSALKCYDSKVGDNVTECSYGEIGCLSIVDCRMGMFLGIIGTT